MNEKSFITSGPCLQQVLYVGLCCVCGENILKTMTYTKESFHHKILCRHLLGWLVLEIHLSRVTRKPAFAYVKTKPQTSCAVTAQLISAFVFATQIVQSLFFLNPKFKASSHLLWLFSPDCVGPAGRKHRRHVFSQHSSFIRIEPQPDKSNNLGFESSKDSDQ